jgi:DNA-binding NarL/FixJ family response regulator
MAIAPTIALCPALIVDADPAAQQRLRQVLPRAEGPSVAVDAVADLAAAKARLESAEYALVLADTGPLGMAGIEFIAWVHTQFPQATCVVVSTWGRKERVMAALRAGAAGYLLKVRDDAELARSLASVQSGGVPIDPAVARCMLDELNAVHAPSAPTPGTASSRLSNREAEILNLVSRGCSNREIAEMTSLSRFTVESHIKKVYRKLSVGSRTAAVFEAKAMGLLQ